MIFRISFVWRRLVLKCPMIILFRYRMYLNKRQDSWVHIFCAMPFYAFRLYLIKSSMPHRESLSLWWKIKDKNDQSEPDWRGGAESDGRSRAWKCHTRTKVGGLTRFFCLFRSMCLCHVCVCRARTVDFSGIASPCVVFFLCLTEFLSFPLLWDR